ncbi:hypothetical protein AGMMS49925_04310 [Deltaproteobacteria bacterium]|nr:hypothetical protein AGMMS49925_04310 [Deltaproteobacteria bacterium]
MNFKSHVIQHGHSFSFDRLSCAPQCLDRPSGKVYSWYEAYTALTRHITLDKSGWVAGEVLMPKVPVLGGATGLVGQALTRVLVKHGWQVET